MYVCRYRPLTKKLEEIQDWFHGPQNWDNRTIMMTSGAQEGLSKAVDMCMNRGDPVIMPDPVYTGAIDLVRPTFSFRTFDIFYSLEICSRFIAPTYIII